MTETLADIREDLSQRAALAQGCAARVWEFQGALERRGNEGHEAAAPYVRARAEELSAVLGELVATLQARLAESWTEADVADLLVLTRESGELLRTLHGEMGFLFSALDWQSPSFLNATFDQAGMQLGRITGTVNDYKRDWHLDAFDFEKAFSKEYLDARLRLPPHVYVTSSGMSAFATLLAHLQFHADLKGPILVGQGSYFENRWVLQRAFPGQVHEVDEFDAEGILAAARRLKPSLVLLDSLCNTDTLAMPDLAALLPALLRDLPRTSSVVVDNSGLATSCQPLAHVPRVPGHARLYVLESLNKFHQFGFDRVTGGVVWTTGGMPTGLQQTRVHLGTNLPDASTHALPRPNRALLDARLARHGRNALRLAERLNAFLAANPSGHVSHVVYPGLASHPAHAWTKDLPFCGALLVVAFQPGRQTVLEYQRFVDRVMEEATRAGVPLLSGTSFGLDTTRVYLTALHTDQVTRPFVRIAVGTETAAELDALAHVFETAFA